jgi:hypothetical protein
VHLPQVASIEAEAKALEFESDDEPTIIEDLSDEEKGISMSDIQQASRYQKGIST